MDKEMSPTVSPVNAVNKDHHKTWDKNGTLTDAVLKYDGISNKA